MEKNLPAVIKDSDPGKIERLQDEIQGLGRTEQVSLLLSSILSGDRQGEGQEERYEHYEAGQLLEIFEQALRGAFISSVRSERRDYTIRAGEEAQSAGYMFFLRTTNEGLHLLIDDCERFLIRTAHLGAINQINNATNHERFMYALLMALDANDVAEEDESYVGNKYVFEAEQLAAVRLIIDFVAARITQDVADFELYRSLGERKYSSIWNSIRGNELATFGVNEESNDAQKERVREMAAKLSNSVEIYLMMRQIGTRFREGMSEQESR